MNKFKVLTTLDRDSKNINASFFRIQNGHLNFYDEYQQLICSFAPDKWDNVEKVNNTSDNDDTAVIMGDNVIV